MDLTSSYCQVANPSQTLSSFCIRLRAPLVG